MPLLPTGGLSQALICKGGPGSGTITSFMPLGLLLAFTHSVTMLDTPPVDNGGQIGGLLLSLTQAGNGGSSTVSSSAGQVSGLSLALTRAS
jgi:hypothetical protein